MIKKTFPLILLILILITNRVKAEKPPIKFGKINNDEIEMECYTLDSSASAVILCDYGVSSFQYTDANGFNISFSRNIRIKILNKEGYKWAKQEIYLREGKEDLTKIKAFTYNFENGKEEKIKLEKKDIFREQYNKYWEIVKFEMPQIKPGSIIDIEYSTDADSWSIPDWYFQSEIPTVLSQYETRIPEYFDFKQLQKGYIQINTEHKRTNSSLTISSKSRSGGMVTQTNYQNHKIDFLQNEYVYIGKDVPAFHKEKHLTSMENYLSSIHYELQSYKMPNQIRKQVTASWEGISKDLLSYEDFGLQINRGGFLKDKIEEINNQGLSDADKVVALYAYIQHNMNWNGYRSPYSNSIATAWKDKNGTSGDINLMLIAGLKKMGLNADAVILSTRDNGFIHPGQIMLEQFNYVIAAVNLGESIILLDATDKFTPAGTLPKRCLNDKGRLITKNGGQWVKLPYNGKNKKAYQTSFKITENGLISGSMKEVHYNYAAINKRTSLQYHNSEEEYIEDYQKQFTETSITLDSITEKNNISKPLSIQYHFESDNLIESAGNLLLIKPFLCSDIKENPFKLERRDYPVDYSCPQSITYVATIELPENYAIEELPKPMRLALPERSGSFIYSIQNLNGKLMLVSKFNINNVTFLPQDYEGLKEFYNRVIETQNQQIILKKI